MSKNILLISLATITLAATTLTNVASSRADSVAIVGSGSTSEPAPDNFQRADGRCNATYPPFCGYPSTPSPTAPVHTIPIPYPSYPLPGIPQYPQPPMSETPGRVMCLVAPCPDGIK